MDIQSQKLWLIEWLLKVQDARILNRIESIVKESPDFWDDLSPELKDGINKGLEDYKSGRVFTSEEVKARIKTKFNF